MSFNVENFKTKMSGVVGKVKSELKTKGVTASFNEPQEVSEKNQTDLLKEAELNKSMVKKFEGKKGTVRADVKELAHEAVDKGATAQEAVNGAKAVVSAVGEQSGKSALESSIDFEEHGLTDSEKEQEEIEKSTQEMFDEIDRKINLEKKYGEKLEAKHKAEEIKQNHAAVDEMLSE